MAANDQDATRTENEQKDREAGQRTAARDRALVRLDEQDVKDRMLEAFDRFVHSGFAAHLIGVKARAAIEYRIALYPDGTQASPSQVVQDVADEFRLDYNIERGEPGVDGWLIVLYPRW